VREARPEVGLHLVHYSVPTVTGANEPTEPQEGICYA
jgi:hypothetical protein